uniref:Uncharacterized protein n=2 Tax=Guillardia theta TaxID=55529 RepID=A0A7S4UWR2_GUITH|mmetsp:Transcript_50156/g.156889  ORF Transcript_50156/g.156889 Transcript_50156/m.156889 type:complete len:147 (+) Transcript_50156:61-501(+)
MDELDRMSTTDMKEEILQLRLDKKNLVHALTAKQEEIENMKRSRTAIIEAREQNIKSQIHVAMQNNEKLEKDYEKLNLHAKQLTAAVQKVVQERKLLETQILALESANKKNTQSSEHHTTTLQTDMNINEARQENDTPLSICDTMC